MRWWTIIAGVGAGAGVFVIYEHLSYASEDSTGETIPMKDAKAIEIPSSGSLATRALEVGIALVGVKENPAGSNRGPQVDDINRGFHSQNGDKLLGKPWCASFCRFCYEKAAADLGRPGPFASVNGTLAKVSSWADLLNGYECDPKPGAAALIKSKIPGGAWKHATLVVKSDGDKIRTVEGNHNDAVAVVARRRSDFGGIFDVERWIADQQRAPLVSGILGRGHSDRRGLLKLGASR